MSDLDSVYIIGAGKVGSGLARALRDVGVNVTLRALRKGLPSKPIDAPFVVLAVRDRDLLPLAERLRDAHLIGHREVVVVHCAGALGPEPLAPLRSANVAVAQMHPMISFASPRVGGPCGERRRGVSGRWRGPAGACGSGCENRGQNARTAASKRR